MTDPLPVEPQKAPRSWGRMLAIAGLLGIGVYSCAQWSGYEFRKMLAFTTADTEALRRLSPDPTKPTFRFTLKTDVVQSKSCPGGLHFCTYDRLEGEKDTIKLPRSITYEFPTLLVTGVEKDGSGIYLSLWHRSLDPTFDGETPPGTLMVLDENGQPTNERWQDRQARNLRNEALVDVTLRKYYYSATSNMARQFGAPPSAPTCDIEERGHGVLVYRHKQGYEATLRNDPEIKSKQCKIGVVELDYKKNSYAIYLINNKNQVETQIFCNETSANCNVSYFFENWGFSFSIRKKAENEVIETQKRVTDFIKSRVVARSYSIPAEGER